MTDQPEDSLLLLALDVTMTFLVMAFDAIFCSKR